jgi:hypothetical protein
LKNKRLIISILLLLFGAAFSVLQAQMITGVWKGKINRQKVEVKIIQNGDNLTGTVYYYESADNYRRYSIKGYFDPNSNEAVWWDDQLIEEKTGRMASPGKAPLLSRADFNCPGYGKMMLGGKASRVENENERAGDVNLDKTDWPSFTDEWDFVLENFTVGANDPDIIDSVDLISTARKSIEEKPINTITEEKPVASKFIEQPVIEVQLPKEETKDTTASTDPGKPLLIEEKIPDTVATRFPLPTGAGTLKIPDIEEKFVTRKKIFATEIPVSGDSIELRFYDNAQIDGDSISLFLNDKLIFEHIKLTEKAYIIKLPVAELNASNELIMVAENLGSIPPNTSYMIAEMGDKRYEARLESTEGSSALIRLVKKSL